MAGLNLFKSEGVMSDDLGEKVAVLANTVKTLKEGVESVNDEMPRILRLEIKQDELEKRLVLHSSRHENNYKELQEELKDMKSYFGTFKDELLESVQGINLKLSANKGRDSVLKYMTGATVGILTGFIMMKIKGG